MYIYSKYDEFQIVLSTIDGNVIEQLFHVAWLKNGLLRLPNGKTANNITVFFKYKQDLQNTLQTDTPPVSNEAENSNSVMHVDLSKSGLHGTYVPSLFICLMWMLEIWFLKKSYHCTIASLEGIIQGYVFEITALVVPSLGTLDILWGTRELQEVNVALDFHTHTLKFKSKSILMKVTKDVILMPNDSKRNCIVRKTPMFFEKL